MDTLPNSQPECPKSDSSIHVNGNAIGGTYNTGIINQYNSGNHSPSEIYEVFVDHTERVLRNSRPSIEGIEKPIPRAEIADVEKALLAGHAVIISGTSGTGKSGLGFELIENAKRREQCCLLLDCRIFNDVRNPIQLVIGTLSLHRACKSVNTYKSNSQPFLIVFDQMDGVAGTPAGVELIQAAADCHCYEELCIQVVVISRNVEVQEQQLLTPLARNKFQTITSAPLLNAAPYLESLGIQNTSSEVIEMSRNLLNLSLIATIHDRKPDFDFQNIVNEVELWEGRLEIFLQQNVVNGHQWLSELVLLAKRALSADTGTILLDNPLPESQLRLLSEGFIERHFETSQVCTFFHENFQDFLYAKDAVETGKTIDQVINELGRFRVQGIFVWMDKISQTKSSLYSEREAMLRRLFNV